MQSNKHLSEEGLIPQETVVRVVGASAESRIRHFPNILVSQKL
jgi:hypothetical protein